MPTPTPMSSGCADGRRNTARPRSASGRASCPWPSACWAARAAVMAGCDFLKTSTGKAAVGATLEAAAVLLAVIEEAEGKVGFKAAGGIRTAQQAASYLFLAEQLIDPSWASPNTFRFGASTLLDDLLR